MKPENKKKRIVVIDGQGGGLGRSVTEQVKKEWPDAEITAVGTNSAATAAMLKAGADIGATGENAVVYNSRSADLILGPLGICLSGAMHGEISPAMAASVCESPALKLLVPVSKCNARIIGVGEKNMTQHVAEIIAELRDFYGA